MKLNEILEQLNQTEIKTSLSELINVEISYIPFLTKRDVSDMIANLSVYLDEETNLLMHDMLLEDLLSVVFKTIYLTDVEIENILDENNEIDIDVAVEAYDKLLTSGIYQYIESQIINDDISMIVDYKVRQKLDTRNSVTYVLSNLINDIASKIPNQEDIQSLITSLPSQLSQLNNLNILGGSDKPTPKTKSKSKSKKETVTETVE